MYRPNRDPSTSPRVDAEAVRQEISDLLALLYQSRAVFPTIRDNVLGQREFSTAPYYQARGYSATIRLAKPITSEFIEYNRRLGKWMNENALIRLYGILEYHGLVGQDKKINKEYAGWKEADLLRRIRNALTKTSLNYRPSKKENVDLRHELIKHFELPDRDVVEGEIPVPINHVVDPIFHGCRDYVAAYAAAQRRPADARER